MKARVTETELLRLAPDVTSRQLKRWRMEGIFPRPEQVHVEGLRGSVSYYPSWAKGQLQVVRRLHREERRLDELRFRLWWNDYWVDPSTLRETLTALLAEALQEFDELAQQYGSPIEAAEAVAAELRRMRSRNPFLRYLRFQVRGRTFDLETVVFALVLMAFGVEPVWESPDVGSELEEQQPRELMERAFGLVQASRQTWQGIGPLLDEPADIRGVFERMLTAGILPVANLKTILEEAHDDELQVGRDDAKVVTEDLRAVAEALELLVGRGAFGLGVLRLLQRRPTAIAVRVMFVPMLIALRKEWTAEETANFVAVKQALAEAAPKAQRLTAIIGRKRTKSK